MEFFLERFSLEQLLQWKADAGRLREFQQFYFGSLASQRAGVRERLKAALLKEAKPCKISLWARIVDFQYSTEPLSAEGSLCYVGGRYNVGNIDPSRFPPFQALYIAKDFDTAYREKFGAEHATRNKGVTPEEMFLAKTKSWTKLAISGELDRVFTMDEASLKKFIELTKSFRLPKELLAMAADLHLGPPMPNVISTAKSLVISLSRQDWRNLPVGFDIPSNSQVMGELAKAAGIQAIRFRSSRAGGWCLAIFPENLDDRRSYIEIADKVPSGVKISRIGTKI